jgi:hypothetical protein
MRLVDRGEAQIVWRDALLEKIPELRREDSLAELPPGVDARLVNEHQHMTRAGLPFLLRNAAAAELEIDIFHNA